MHFVLCKWRSEKVIFYNRACTYRESNVNVPGVWMYHIGNRKGSNVGAPDINTGDREFLV